MAGLRGMIRSPFQRFALAMPLIVASIVGLVLYPLYREAERLIRDEVHAAIEQELLSLDDHLHDHGMEGLVEAIGGLVEAPIDPDAAYLLESADGRRLAGNLAKWPAGLQVADEAWFRVPDQDGQYIEGKMFVLFGGEHLLVGRRSPLAHFRSSMLRRLAWSAGLIVLVTAVSSFLFMRYLHRRLERLAQDADAIHLGHLSRRLQARPDGDELDALALRFNAAFDEIEGLVDATRNVSSAIAHDMRRPLIALKQGLDDALAEAPGDHAAHRRLAPLSAQIDRLLQTFAALLRLGRLEAGAWAAPNADCALDAVVEDAVDLHRPLADACGREILTRIEPAKLPGDRQLLSQLVCNLLDNALRHGQGRIEVELQQRPEALQLVVRDHGPGVPEDALEHIFDRFYRVDPARGGTEHSGVGLTLARAIVRFHGGALVAANASPGLRLVATLGPAEGTPRR